MKLIRKNKKKGDCGVVAAFNAASWCKFDRTYLEVEKIAKSCGYNPNRGIYFFQFAKLVKKLNLPAKKVNVKSLEQVIDKLHKGKLLIFLYTPVGCGIGHAVSAFSDHKGKIVLINPEGQRKTWGAFTSDLYYNGAKNFAMYEVPHRT